MSLIAYTQSYLKSPDIFSKLIYQIHNRIGNLVNKHIIFKWAHISLLYYLVISIHIMLIRLTIYPQHSSPLVLHGFFLTLSTIIADLASLFIVAQLLSRASIFFILA